MKWKNASINVIIVHVPHKLGLETADHGQNNIHLDIYMLLIYSQVHMA